MTGIPIEGEPDEAEQAYWALAPDGEILVDAGFIYVETADRLLKLTEELMLFNSYVLLEHFVASEGRYVSVILLGRRLEPDVQLIRQLVRRGEFEVRAIYEQLMQKWTKELHRRRVIVIENRRPKRNWLRFWDKIFKF